LYLVCVAYFLVVSFVSVSQVILIGCEDRLQRNQ